MDRSAALRELFDKNSPYIEAYDSFVALNVLRAHPFNRAFVIVGANAEAAVRATQLRIKEALRAMEECSPVVADLESTLLMQEAELLSALNSIKDLCASIKEAQDQLEKNRHRRWTSLLSSAKERELDVRSSSSEKPSLQLLQHFETALETLEDVVGRWRLRLTLCKEELALYRQEMFMFARAGVLSCSKLEKHLEGDCKSCITEADSSRGDRTATGLLTSCQKEGKLSSAVVVASVVDRVIKEAARTVTVPPLSQGGNVWSLISGRQDETGIRGPSFQDTGVPNFVYDAEEEKRLMDANLVLQERQKEASAEDAKAVEASVRELSQLTSLINDHVLHQNEQFSVVLRNTEKAQMNMQKGVGEVKKTLSCFWNSTRQLIACLWFSTLLLLVANWVIR